MRCDAEEEDTQRSSDCEPLASPCAHRAGDGNALLLSATDGGEAL
jgi:hypothetical protein